MQFSASSLVLLTILTGSAFCQTPDVATLNDLAPKAVELIYARPFEVEQPIPFVVGGKIEASKKGYIVVLKADLRVLEPMDVPDHVIFAGKAVTQKINSGYRSGYVVAMVPEVNLFESALWVGSRLLPDTITPEVYDREQRAATERKIKPLTKRQVEEALAKGGSVLRVKDMNELWFETKPLILQYSPQEREMAESLRK
ncbi:MAG: hypothetical protein AB1486_27805 [Planctomycetota bacterium]